MKHKIRICILVLIVLSSFILMYIIQKSEKKMNDATKKETSLLIDQNEMITPDLSNIANYPITNKDQLTSKMINATEFFETCSGKYKNFSTRSPDLNYTTEFMVSSVDNKVFSYEETKFSNPRKTSFDLDRIIIVNNGNELIRYKDKKGKITRDLLAKTLQSARDKTTKLNDSLTARIEQTQDGREPIYHYKDDRNYLDYSKTVLLPEEIVFGFLKDYSLWEMEIGSHVGNLVAIKVKGKLSDEFKARFDADNFTMDVESDTGIILELCILKGDQVVETIQTSSLKFNIPLSVSDFAKPDNLDL